MPESRIDRFIRYARRSRWFFRRQATVVAALSGGSLTAALLNLAGVIAISLVRSAQSNAMTIGSWAKDDA